MESDFIPHKVIKEKWREITGDSFYVFINQWQNVRDMKRFPIYYLTKYLTRLGGVDYLTAMQMKDFHLVGSSKGPRRKEPSPEPVEKERWIRIDQLEFEAIFLDFYEKVPEIKRVTNNEGPPDKQRTIDQWANT